MPIPPRKKKPADFALLLGEPEQEPEDSLDDLDAEEPDEDEDYALEDEGADPLLDDMGEEVSALDPEQAALCETLGFSDPEQQQALVDLIKLVNSADPLATESSDSLPPLPESPY